MNKELIHSLTSDFEAHSQHTESGIEFWLARDLQHLLGYTEWRNFSEVINKAKTACEVSDHSISDHFVDVNKMVKLGSGSTREVDDIMLTRYACYLLAQNGDSKKAPIAFAQTYFAMQTRKAELIEQHLLETERVQAREKLKQTEKELSETIHQLTGGGQNFALIRSKGDHALYGRSTQAMKEKWNVPEKKPLSDFAPTIILKAKDFATEITIHNARAKEMQTEGQISQEHVTNNQAVRDTLIDRGITPENLIPEEDAAKVKRRLDSTVKKSLKKPDSLDQ